VIFETAAGFQKLERTSSTLAVWAFPMASPRPLGFNFRNWAVPAPPPLAQRFPVVIGQRVKPDRMTARYGRNRLFLMVYRWMISFPVFFPELFLMT